MNLLPSPRRAALASSLLLLAAAFAGPLAAQLDLPRGGKRSGGDRPVGRELPPADDADGALDLPSGGAPDAPEVGYSPDDHGRARFLLDQLAGEKDPESKLVDQATEQLVQLGPAALDPARAALVGSDGATLSCATRVLLRIGTPADRARIAERLERKVPSRVAGSLLEALRASDPVLVSPTYLVGLLDHPTGAMRTSAQRLLGDQVGEEHFGQLHQLLRSGRRDTRLRAVELLAALDDPAVERVLLDRLDDRAASVAWQAASTLADRKGDGVDAALVDRAFRDGRVDRGGAYALLSIVEREDRRRRAILDDRHVEALLDELRDDSPLVAGAAACALAGIGFRSEASGALEWLDLSVPHQLVRVSSGAEFHVDFGSLQAPAQGRLQLLSGESFGTDGAAWTGWWTSVAGGFRARRAVLTLGERDALALELFLREPSGEARALLGPLVEAPREHGARSVEVVHLTEPQVSALVDFLATEGLFDARLLPRTLDAAANRTRVLDVSFAGAGKRFEVPEGAEEPWLDRIAARVRAFCDANSWQRWFPRSQFEDRHAFWRVERAFWDANADPAAALAKRRDYVLAFLLDGGEEGRDGAVAELARLCEAPRGPLSAADLPRAIEATFLERYYGGRAETLLDVVLDAAAGSDGVVPPEIATDLLARVVRRWDEDADGAAASVLGRAGLETTFQVATSEEPRARRFAAVALAALEGRPAEDRLLELLMDPDSAVEAAAVRSLGSRGSERAREELLLRSRIADRAVRLEALRAIGHLGGEGVRDALMLALVDPDVGVRVAAVEALADLGDPEVAGLLARSFGRGPTDPTFRAARRGLRRLGSRGVDEVLRLAASAAPRTRREAGLLLAELLEPEAAPLLLSWLTDHPDDPRVANELAILTGVDHREDRDPAESWWSWWDQVVHDDALAWFVGALEREGREPVSIDLLRPPGTPEGARYLCDRLADPARHLATRAERELGKLLGRDLELTPTRGELREAEVEALRREVAERFRQ